MTLQLVLYAAHIICEARSCGVRQPYRPSYATELMRQLCQRTLVRQMKAVLVSLYITGLWHVSSCHQQAWFVQVKCGLS